MLGKTYDSQVCSIARALEVVGERWSLLIVREAVFAGITRFTDFQHNLGIATNILKARLDSFVDAGIFERSRLSSGVDEYVLTDKGRDLAPALIALTEWGDRWAAPNGRPILYRHASCGADVFIETTCAVHGPIDSAEVEVAPGPGMSLEYIEQRRPRKAPQAG